MAKRQSHHHRTHNAPVNALASSPRIGCRRALAFREGMMPRVTVGKTIRAMCMYCLGAEKPRFAYDCVGPSCALYPAMPWRGKHPHKRDQPHGPPTHEAERVATLAKSYPKRRPSKVFLRRLCRECHIPGETGAPDCGKEDCPLFLWRPWQVGGVPKDPSRQDRGRRKAQTREAKTGRLALFGPQDGPE